MIRLVCSRSCALWLTGSPFNVTLSQRMLSISECDAVFFKTPTSHTVCCLLPFQRLLWIQAKSRFSIMHTRSLVRWFVRSQASDWMAKVEWMDGRCECVCVIKVHNSQFSTFCKRYDLVWEHNALWMVWIEVLLFTYMRMRCDAVIHWIFVLWWSTMQVQCAMNLNNLAESVQSWHNVFKGFSHCNRL